MSFLKHKVYLISKSDILGRRIGDGGGNLPPFPWNEFFAAVLSGIAHAFIEQPLVTPIGATTTQALPLSFAHRVSLALFSFLKSWLCAVTCGLAFAFHLPFLLHRWQRFPTDTSRCSVAL